MLRSSQRLRYKAQHRVACCLLAALGGLVVVPFLHGWAHDADHVHTGGMIVSFDGAVHEHDHGIDLVDCNEDGVCEDLGGFDEEIPDSSAPNPESETPLDHGGGLAHLGPCIIEVVGFVSLLPPAFQALQREAPIPPLVARTHSHFVRSSRGPPCA